MRDFCSNCEFYAPERAPDNNPCTMDHCVRHNDPYKPTDISAFAVADTHGDWVTKNDEGRGAMSKLICADNMTERTLYLYMTRGKHEVRDAIYKTYGRFNNVVIDVDGEEHRYDADTLISLLESLEVDDD